MYRFIGRTILNLKPNRAIEILSQLLSCMRVVLSQEEMILCDDVVGACIRSCTDSELLDPLIRMLTSDINKIDAYILTGKLKSAYLLAVRLDRSTDVKRIMVIAERNGQESVKKICQLWLQRKEAQNNQS